MELLEKMTLNPAKLYHLPQGRLQEGCPADLVIFDPEEEWIVKDYKSKASNSPFTGWKLKGKVKYTICDGKSRGRIGNQPLFREEKPGTAADFSAVFLKYQE